MYLLCKNKRESAKLTIQVGGHLLVVLIYHAWTLQETILAACKDQHRAYGQVSSQKATDMTSELFCTTELAQQHRM